MLSSTTAFPNNSDSCDGEMNIFLFSAYPHTPSPKQNAHFIRHKNPNGDRDGEMNVLPSIISFPLKTGVDEVHPQLFTLHY